MAVAIMWEAQHCTYRPKQSMEAGSKPAEAQRVPRDGRRFYASKFTANLLPRYMEIEVNPEIPEIATQTKNRNEIFQFHSRTK